MRFIFCVIALVVEICWSDLLAQRIVSLVPSVTQTLVQIGADDKVVGRTSYCPPSDDGKSVIVGDAMTVNIEKIISLVPDAVVTMGLTKPEVVKKLKSLGVNVVELVTPKNFEDICSQTLYLSKLVGCEDKALTLVNAEREIVEASRMGMREKKAIFEIGVNPLWMAVPGTYLDDMLKSLRLSNVVLSGNGSVAREYIVASKPEVIIMTTLYGQTLSEKKMWERLLPGALMIEVDEDIACCPTPTNYRLTLQTIVEKLR